MVDPANFSKFSDIFGRGKLSATVTAFKPLKSTARLELPPFFWTGTSAEAQGELIGFITPWLAIDQADSSDLFSGWGSVEEL